MENKNTNITAWEFPAFTKKIHFVGRTSSIITIATFMAVAAAICIYFDITPTMSQFLASMATIYLATGPNSIVEFFSFTTILGSGASYISFITGNIGNMKLPSIMSSLSAIGVNEEEEGGAEKKEVLSIIIAAVASLEVIVLIWIMVMFSGALTPFLEWKPIQPAFTYILPAIYGLVIAGPLMKAPKVVLPVMVLSVILAKVTANNMAIMLIACIAFGLTICYFINRKKGAGNE